MKTPTHSDEMLNVMLPEKLAIFEEALTELFRAAEGRDFPADLMGPWSKLTLLAEAFRVNVELPLEVTASNGGSS